MTYKTVTSAACILGFDEARSALARFWPVFVDLPRNALEQFKRHIGRRLIQPSGRLRAAAIHDWMINEMRRTFAGDMVFARGRWLLRGAADLVVQFKKVDAAGRTCNVPTRAATEFLTQATLPGIPPGMRVTLGYRLNRMKTEVIDVSLIARDGDRVIWRESVKPSLELPLGVIGENRIAAKKPAKKIKLQPKKEVAEARGAIKKDKKTGA